MGGLIGKMWLYLNNLKLFSNAISTKSSTLIFQLGVIHYKMCIKDHLFYACFAL